MKETYDEASRLVVLESFAHQSVQRAMDAMLVNGAALDEAFAAVHAAWLRICLSFPDADHRDFCMRMGAEYASSLKNAERV